MPLSVPRPSAPALGLALYAVGTLCFALNDALGKWLIGSYGVGQLLLLRSVGAAAILVPLIWRLGGDFRIREQRPIHLLRVLCMAGDTFCFYAATRWLTLADVMTFYMAAPLIITALSAPVLGERVGARRWAAVLVGFVGVVIALRPTGGAFAWVSLIPLAGAAMFAMGVTTTRLLRRSDWLALVTYQFATAGLIGVVAGPLAWAPPSTVDVFLMFLVGIVSMACFICLTKALAIAPPSLLAPVQYTSIVWAMLLGWAVWRDVPTWPMILGNVVIIGSGLIVITGAKRRDDPADAGAAEHWA